LLTILPWKESRGGFGTFRRKVEDVTEDAQRQQVSALVADDDDQNARLLVRILERGGYGPIECTTESEKVVPLTREQRPDLLLLDVSMPTPNGFEILEELGELDDLDPVVVMLTGHDHPSIEAKALELGAAAVVGKTLLMDDLLKRLDDVLAETGRGSAG
jgi:DNA-binding response OmpR family regulator